MNSEDIKLLIKQRGYTHQKVSRILGCSIPTLKKLMNANHNIVYYAVKGLPEMTHITKERHKIVRD